MIQFKMNSWENKSKKKVKPVWSGVGDNTIIEVETQKIEVLGVYLCTSSFLIGSV